jgi:hypothetical protein
MKTEIQNMMDQAFFNHNAKKRMVTVRDFFVEDVRCVSCDTHGQLPFLDTEYGCIMRPENGWALSYDGGDVEPICPDCIETCMKNG